MKRVLLFIVMTVFSYTMVNAQKTISGRVLDKDGKSLSGASVTIKSSGKGVATDENGDFKISAKVGDVIVASSLGFVPSQTKVLASTLSVSLVLTKNSEAQLEDVVVTTALGVRKNPREFGGAATILSNKTLTSGKAVNIQQALNGKVSGVSITTANSGVFEDAKINIRGIRSLTGNNQPLFILDGAPTPLSYLSAIPPDDIQDMTVLKSAASASLYGSDGVNGVIVVNTRKGTKKPQVNFSTTYQMNRVAFFPKLQKIYGGGAGEILDQYGNYGYVPYENQQFGPAFDGSMQDIGIKLEDGSIQRGKYSNDHFKDKIKFFNTGYTVQNSLSISGEDFYFGLQDAVIKGMTPDDKNRRTSFRFNSGKKFDKLSISYGINYVLQNYDVFYEEGSASLIPAFNGGIFDQILQTANNIPLLDYKDWRNNKFAQYSNYYNEYGINPYWEISNLRKKGKRDNLIANLDINYQLFSWLKASVKLSSSLNIENVNSTVAPINVTDWAHANRDNTTYTNRLGSVSTSQTTQSRINFDYLLSGDTSLGKDFKIKYIVGGMVRQNKSADVRLKGNNLVVPNLFNQSVKSGSAETDNYPTGNYQTISRVLSAYGSVGFGYKGWANIEFTARNDWDSRLKKENQSFFYPGVNAALILSDAIGMLKNSKTISFLKVRGALSKSGNVNLGAHSLQATYNPPAASTTSGFPYSNFAGFTANNTFHYPGIKPEFVLTKEVGVEITFLKNRISFEGTYFYQTNTDQILNTTQSSTTGFTTGVKNAADFKNYGVELDLGLNPLIKIGRKSNIDFKINATYNNNQVAKTFNNDTVTIGGTSGFTSRLSGSPTANNVAITGLPAFAFQLSDYERSPSGKVIVDRSTGYPSVASVLVIKGRTLPTWVIGLTPSYSFKSLNISMTWEYKGGHDFYAGIGPNADNSGISARSAEFGRRRFVFPNSVYKDDKGNYIENTSIQVQDGNYGFWTSSAYNTGIATNYFSSAAAWRLRELNVSYGIPTSFLGKKSFIKKLTVSAVGRNLLLLTPKSNQWGDPEFNYDNGGNTYGLSSSFQTPSSRFFGGTISFQF